MGTYILKSADEVRTQKEFKQARKTHFLKSADGWTSHNMVRTSKSGTPTHWRQVDEQVRM
jgi:hypothetical protein